METIEHKFDNILVIDFGQLGDVVLSLPALNAIRQNFPASHIAVLTGLATGEVVALSGLADGVIKVDRVELRDGPTLSSIAKIFGFVGEIRRHDIDLVIDLHSLPETNILAFLSKAKHRLLANRESRSLDRLSNFRPFPPLEDKSKHLSDRYLDVLQPLGITDAKREFRFPSSSADVDYVNQHFFSDSAIRTVGLFPGAGHPSRCWSLENFAALAAKLEADGYRPVIFLGPEEESMKERVVEMFTTYAIIIDGLSISRFIAASAQLDAFVTNDTGPMHLAACAGAPILLLLDERAPITYLPLTKKLSVIRNETIDRIFVDEVFVQAKLLLTKFKPTGK
ncbi:MAG: glycosyltransferase family 9 protein [Pyrinomonadaceae bacterium]